MKTLSLDIKKSLALKFAPFIRGIIRGIILVGGIFGIKINARTVNTQGEIVTGILENNQEGNTLKLIEYLGLGIGVIVSIPLFFLFFVVLFLRVFPESFLKGYKKERLKSIHIQTKINNIDEMSGYEFEVFLKELFKDMGYKVEMTKRSGDQGADLIVSKEGIRTIVQAKRHKGKISNGAIQEVVAAVKHYNSQNAMVITSSFFTKSAKELAISNSVELIDKKALEELMKKSIFITKTDNS